MSHKECLIAKKSHNKHNKKCLIKMSHYKKMSHNKMSHNKKSLIKMSYNKKCLIIKKSHYKKVS